MQTDGYQGLEIGGNEENAPWERVLFGSDGHVSERDRGDGCTTLSMSQMLLSFSL